MFDIIATEPSLYHEGAEGFLCEMLSKYLEWVPGDQRGSKHYATLESLKRAVSIAGLEVAAADLTITCTADSMAAASIHSHSVNVLVTHSDNRLGEARNQQINQIQGDHDWNEHGLLKISDYQ